MPSYTEIERSNLQDEVADLRRQLAELQDKRITLVIPYDEGLVDVDGDISAGIRVYRGHLSKEQLLKLTEEEAYPRRAVLEFYDKDGKFNGLQVTFSNDGESDQEEGEVAGPTYVDDKREGGGGCVGTEFNEEHAGFGHLMYTTEYRTLSDAPE